MYEAVQKGGDAKIGPNSGELKLKDGAKLAELAKKFSEVLPSEKFTIAEIQGYLLQWKLDPQVALDGAKQWGENLQAEKESKDKAMKEKLKHEQGKVDKVKEDKTNEDKAKEDNTKVERKVGEEGLVNGVTEHTSEKKSSGLLKTNS